MFFKYFFRVVFPNFCPLDAGICHFEVLFRILREISSLEPAGKLGNLEARSKNVQINCLMCFLFNPITGLECFRMFLEKF